MKITFKIILAIALFLLFTKSNTFAQGCVAIRSTGGICTMNEHPDSTNSNSYWLLNNNSRYYKSLGILLANRSNFSV
jgi:hypothetical protein